MILTYTFYFIGLLLIVATSMDISTWTARAKIARELYGKKFNLSEWSDIKPIIQEHIIFGSIQKYILLMYLLIGVMSSQWLLFIGLIGIRILFLSTHYRVSKKYAGSNFNDIVLPIIYRLLILFGLSFIVLNRFHFHLFDI